MLNNKKTTILAFVALVSAIAMLLSGWLLFGPKSTLGEKTVIIQVTHGDDSTNVFSLTTAAEYLGDALLAAGLIQGEEGQFGLYVRTVDGETADESKQQYWVYTKNGGQVNYGVDMCPIADGEQYEFILKTFS